MNRLWTPGLGRHLMRHPADAVTLARAGWRLRREHWPRRSPFLPIPDREYWHFRVVTVNGSSPVPITPLSMVEAANWALAQPSGGRS